MQAEAQRYSGRPVMIFVNGYNDCCATSMHRVRHGIATRFGAEIIDVTWDGYITTQGMQNWSGSFSSIRVSNDSFFTSQAPKLINQIDPNRPVIIIGHSFGGDSILKTLPRINRKLLFVGVIDPTAKGGLRAPIKGYFVPPNVDYFYNRWQENPNGIADGGVTSNVFPLDGRLVNGKIQCHARQCDQDAQNLVRNGDGSPIEVPCKSYEVSCKGYNPLPGWFPGGKRGWGTKSQRITHEGMPTDDYIEFQVRETIDRLLR